MSEATAEAPFFSAPTRLTRQSKGRCGLRANLTFVAVANLLHDRVRFLITVLGITVALLLVFVQGGMYFGFMRNASGIIDRSRADVWVVSRHSPNFDWSRPLPERYLNKVRSTPGVLEAKSLVFAWAFMRLPGGETEQVELIGFHPSDDPGWGEPWGFVTGGARSVVGGDFIIMDEEARRKIPGLKVGSRAEIMEHEVRVVGMTRGIRPLTTAPYAFASYETAKKLVSYIGKENTTYLLVRAEPGVPPEALRDRLQARMPYVDVLTKKDFSRRTRRYWTIQTGMGFGFLMMTLLATVVGVTIVGQTVYAATMEHLREYATLKALGATDRELKTILWTQAAVAAAAGYALGTALTAAFVPMLDRLGLQVSIPDWLYLAVLGLDFAICLGASLVSVRKALSLDPAMVFRT